MRERQLTALVRAAADGVERDGLRVERRADGYAVATPEDSWAGLDEDGLRATLAELPRYVSNWHFWTTVADPGTSRWAFLRWVERADDRPVPDRYDALEDGTAREWGQLRVVARLGADGERRYDLRHVDDADADPADLEAFDEPLDLRRPTTFDDRERYRPLRTAPTLPTGWRLDGLDGRDLVEAVDVVYPATVANWHREREGGLDVTHWAETADRQTGIYDVIDELDPEAVEWIAEACCVDSQCLKRREWEYDDDRTVDVDAGDGTFPCREPCSLVVAAARRWTTLEREDERTYEFELTPSEKAQVEAIVDAVADGRVDRIREADVSDGANRYRARYLRAKRFDDAGNLCGVPTEPGDGED
ncbi:MAG: DR2241 family protein [Haloferacaceae archaeon]